MSNKKTFKENMADYGRLDSIFFRNLALSFVAGAALTIGTKIVYDSGKPKDNKPTTGISVVKPQ